MVCVYLTCRSRHGWEDNIKMDLKEAVRRCGHTLYGSRQGPMAGSYEHSNEHPTFIKSGEFLNI